MKPASVSIRGLGTDRANIHAGKRCHPDVSSLVVADSCSSCHVHRAVLGVFPARTAPVRVAVRILERLHAKLEVAANGVGAVDATRRWRFDVILMNCQMPEMDGFQDTAAICGTDGPCRRTPIVALTANAMEGDRERCVDEAGSQRRTLPHAGKVD